MSHGKRTRKQCAAIAALLESPTLETAAELCGVSVATLKRWMQDPEFRRYFDAESRRLVEESAARARAGADLALETLRRNMSEAPPGVQVSAARVWLDHLRQSDFAEMSRRIEALEYQVLRGGED